MTPDKQDVQKMLENIQRRYNQRNIKESLETRLGSLSPDHAYVVWHKGKKLYYHRLTESTIELAETPYEECGQITVFQRGTLEYTQVCTLVLRSQPISFDTL